MDERNLESASHELVAALQDLIRTSEKKDRLGEELSDDAQIWRLYFKTARSHDSEMLQQWNGSLDTLLIFAGLFSAVSTGFVVESYKQMQPDYALLTYEALAADISGRAFVERTFRVPTSARVINCLWISSLVTSLFASLVAILAKQWLAAYPLKSRDNLRQWAELRQFRLDSLRRWRLPEIIALIPILIHASLMLFLAGLVLFLLPLDPTTTQLALTLAAATYLFYAFTLVSPVIWQTSPFRTLLTPVLLRTYHAIRHRLLPRTAGLLRDMISSPLLSILRFISYTSQTAYVLFRHLIAVSPTLYDITLRWRTRICTSTSRAFLDPWNYVAAFSVSRAAASLSWLSETAETDRYRAVLLALGDTRTGYEVTTQMSDSFKARFAQDMADLWDEWIPALDATRYFRTAVSLTTMSMNSARLSSVAGFTAADDVIHAICSRVDKGFYDLSLPGISVLCSQAEVSRETVDVATESFKMGHDQSSVSPGTQLDTEKVLHVLCGWRRHFERNPTIIAELLHSTLDEKPRETLRKYEEPRECKGTWCNIIDILAVILNAADFGPGFSDPMTASRVADVLLYFCEQHSTDGCHASLLGLFGAVKSLTQPALTSKHITAILKLVPLSFSPERGHDVAAHGSRMFRNLLCLQDTWRIAPGAPSRDRHKSSALNACCEFAYMVLLNCRHCRSQEPQDQVTVLRDILSNCGLEVLRSAPDWHVYAVIPLFCGILCRLPLRHPGVSDVLADFIHSEVTRGVATWTWDLKTAASEQIIHLAQEPGDLSQLLTICDALVMLRQQYSDEPSWQQIAHMVMSDLQAQSRAGVIRHGDWELADDEVMLRVSGRRQSTRHADEALLRFYRAMGVEVPIPPATPAGFTLIRTEEQPNERPFIQHVEPAGRTQPRRQESLLLPEAALRAVNALSMGRRLTPRLTPQRTPSQSTQSSPGLPPLPFDLLSEAAAATHEVSPTSSDHDTTQVVTSAAEDSSISQGTSDADSPGRVEGASRPAHAPVQPGQAQEDRPLRFFRETVTRDLVPLMAEAVRRMEALEPRLNRAMGRASQRAARDAHEGPT